MKNSTKTKIRKAGKLALSAFFSMLFIMVITSPELLASGGASLPSDTIFQRAIDALQGPTGRIFAILAFIGAGFKWYSSRDGEGGQNIARVLIAVSLVLLATSFADFFGFSGALV